MFCGLHFFLFCKTDGGKQEVCDELQALERKVEKLIAEVHKLGTEGAALVKREAAAKQTMQAIQDTCSLCSRLDTQVSTSDVQRKPMLHTTCSSTYRRLKTSTRVKASTCF